MLTKNQIKVGASVLCVLEQEGATFGPTSGPCRGLSAEESWDELLKHDAEYGSVVVEFREECVCFTIEFTTSELVNDPTMCISRAMTVRRTLLYSLKFTSN